MRLPVPAGPDTRSPGVVPDLLGRAHQSFVTPGRLAVMSAAVARALATDIPSGRVPFREFVAQAWFVLSVSVLPTLLVTVPFGVTTAIQVGRRAQQLGAPPSPRSPSPSDLPLAEAKSAVFGLIVGLVACHEGLTTRGRPTARRTR